MLACVGRLLACVEASQVEETKTYDLQHFYIMQGVYGVLEVEWEVVCTHGESEVIY